MAEQDEVTVEPAVDEVVEPVVDEVAPAEPKAKNLSEMLEESSRDLDKVIEEKTKVVDDKKAEAPPTPPIEKIDPLAYWTNEEKQFFASLTPEQQKKIMSMHTGSQKVFEKKTLEISKKTKEYEPILKEYAEIDRVFKPYEAQLKQTGGSKAQYIEDLIDSMKSAAETPIDFIVELMELKNITPDQLADGIEAYAKRKNDPLYTQLSPLKNQVKDLQRKINQEQEYRQNIEQQKQRQEVESQIEQFKNSKDEEGNPKFPYFEAVQEQMAVLSQAKGETDLEKLYQEAVWLNPQIRESLLISERKKALQEQKEEAQKAKIKNAAGLNLKNSPKVSTSKDVEKTLEEIIAETEAELNSN